MTWNSGIRHVCPLVLLMCGPVCAQESLPAKPAPQVRQATRDADDAMLKVLSASEWRRLDSAVDRALAWLAAQQQPDGSFPTLTQGQPGVTSLCVLAFMEHGHIPGDGPYGEQLEMATKYIVS